MAWLRFQMDLSDTPDPNNFILIDSANKIVSVPAGAKEAEIVGLMNKFGFVVASSLAEKLSLLISWNGASRTVTIG